MSDGMKCQLTDEPTWIIDPIDGTTNFVHRYFTNLCIKSHTHTLHTHAHMHECMHTYTTEITANTYNTIVTLLQLSICRGVHSTLHQ